MTQEDKELLLKDLCARLPYGVKVCARYNTGNRYTTEITAMSFDKDYIQIRQNDLHPYTGSSIEDIRPYLCPMSSMTEDESEEFFGITITHNRGEDVDWLNAHHFDYRGLIEKGLAIEVTEENNPYV